MTPMIAVFMAPPTRSRSADRFVGMPKSTCLTCVDTAPNRQDWLATPGSERGSVTNRQACAGGIVLDSEGRILLVKRAHEPGMGLWSIPGGRCQPGESREDACDREVKEETGL